MPITFCKSMDYIVEQICAKFSKKCSLAVKSAIVVGCLLFDTLMD